jgi:carbon storage regulator
MLVLNRRLRESVVIGDNITVTVVSIAGNSVRLAFDAPGDITVHRAEVLERIRREQKRSAEEFESPAI